MWKATIKSIKRASNGTGNIIVNFCDETTICATKVYNICKSNCNVNSFLDNVLTDLKAYIDKEKQDSLDYENVLKMIEPCLNYELTVDSKFEVPPKVPEVPAVPDKKTK